MNYRTKIIGFLENDKNDKFDTTKLHTTPKGLAYDTLFRIIVGSISKLSYFFASVGKINQTVTSMLVTDVGDEIC